MKKDTKKLYTNINYEPLLGAIIVLGNENLREKTAVKRKCTQ